MLGSLAISGTMQQQYSATSEWSSLCRLWATLPIIIRSVQLSKQTLDWQWDR